MRVRLCLSLVLTVSLGLSPFLVRADLFDAARRVVRTDLGQADSSGVLLRGGSGLDTGLQGASTTLVRGSANVGGACGSFDFWTSYQQQFEEMPERLEALLYQVLSGLPMLVLCYVSPTQCDMAKHWQALINATIQARYAQCQQVQTAMAYAGLRLRGGQTSQCLETQATAGKDLSSAMAYCNTDVASVRTPAGQQATQMDLVRETLSAAGANQETQQLLRNLVGEVTLNAQGGTLGSRQHRPTHSLLKRYEDHRREAENRLREAVRTIASTGVVPDTLLRDLSVPGQAMPRAALDALAALQRDPVRAESLLNKLATGLGMIRLTWEVHELHGELDAAESVNVQLTDEQRHLLQQRLAALQRELDQVTQKKATIEQHLQPALEALLSEYSAVQQEAARVGLRAPSTTPPRTPYRGQGPTGYGQ